MQPTNALMEFREIEKKTVPGIKAFQMNSLRKKLIRRRSTNKNTAHEISFQPKQPKERANLLRSHG